MTTTTTNAATVTTVSGTCPRCSGRGEISAYRHVRAGICFRCFGAGTVAVKINPRPVCPAEKAAQALTAKKIQAVKTGDLSKYSYAQLLAARKFALAYSRELAAVWQERGEPIFQAACEYLAATRGGTVAEQPASSGGAALLRRIRAAYNRSPVPLSQREGRIN